MFEGIEIRLERDGIERQVVSWRTLASAWALVLVLMVLFAGGSALACLHGRPHPDRPLAGAVIPQHDPCVGPGLASAPGHDGCESMPLSLMVNG